MTQPNPQSPIQNPQSPIQNPKSKTPSHFALSTTEPVSYARPSVDVLFESATDTYGKGVVGIILTGENQDGARGLAAIKKAGGMAIVQDPDTAMADSMPKAAIAATVVDKILSLEEIGLFLAKIGSEEADNWKKEIS